MENPLSGKVIVITGASTGIGRATALKCAQQNARLVLSGRREDALHSLAQECEKMGGRALPVVWMSTSTTRPLPCSGALKMLLTKPTAK